MPGYVATSFSEGVRGNAPALLPQEVASNVAEMLEAPQAPAVVLEVGRRSYGSFGFSSVQAAAVTTPRPSSTAAPPEMQSKSSAVADTALRILRLPKNTDLSGGGIGVTPGWDSLGQIEVILALEAELNIHFSSSELTELGSFDALVAACDRKVSNL